MSEKHSFFFFFYIVNLDMATKKVLVREGKSEDVPELARICFEAFGRLHEKHLGARTDFPTTEATIGIFHGILHSGWVRNNR